MFKPVFEKETTYIGVYTVYQLSCCPQWRMRFKEQKQEEIVNVPTILGAESKVRRLAN